MTDTYTPGPWVIMEYGDDDAPNLVIHKSTQDRVCFMATPGSNGDTAKIKADARLIAAAPDLLAALTDLLFEDSNKTEQAILITRIKARAAIAKATGEKSATDADCPT